MAEPARKIETEFVQYAVENFDMRWTSSVEIALSDKGLNLVDLHNALACCEALRCNKTEAHGAFFNVIGVTTENVVLYAKVWISSDFGIYRVEEVA